MGRGGEGPRAGVLVLARGVLEASVKMQLRWTFSTALAGLAGLAFAPHARSAPLFFQGPNPASRIDITNQVAADDFEIKAPTVIDDVTFFLADEVVNNNGLLDTLNSGLAWTIYSDAGIRPGAPLFTGNVVPTLTELPIQDVRGADLFSATIPLSLPSALVPGIYWLAVHEGNWLSPSDGSPVYWSGSLESGFGRPEDDLNFVFDLNEILPGTAWTPGIGNAAFAINGVPEPAVAALLALAPLLMRRRRA